MLKYLHWFKSKQNIWFIPKPTFENSHFKLFFLRSYLNIKINKTTMKILNQQALFVVICLLFGKAISVCNTCIDSGHHKSEPGPENSLFDVVSSQLYIVW